MARILTVGAAIERAIQAATAAAASAGTSTTKAAESAASAVTSANGAANAAAQAAQAALAKADAEATAAAIRIELARGPGNVHSNYIPVDAPNIPSSTNFFTLTKVGDNVILYGGVINNNTDSSYTVFLNKLGANLSWVGGASYSGKERSQHAAAPIRMQEGSITKHRLFICGGINYNQPLATCFIIDPVANGSYILDVVNLPATRYAHTASPLVNGNVLVCGGYVGGPTSNNCIVYDFAANLWTVTQPLPLALQSHAAVTLPDGRVFVCGGKTGSNTASNRAFIYDPSISSGQMWAEVAPMPGVVPTGYEGLGDAGARYFHTATSLPNGDVLVTGGYFAYGFSECLIYSPFYNTWRTNASLPRMIYAHAAASLGDGRVIVCGGQDFQSSVTSAAYTMNPTIL